MTKLDNMRMLVQLHKQGLSDPEIASAMRVTEEWIKEGREFLELPEHFQYDSRQQVKIAVKSQFVESMPSTKKKRSCLKCRNTFMSESAGHRICHTCSKHCAFSLGREWVGAPA